MKRTTLYNLILIFLLIPGTLFLGTRLTGRWYYLTSTLIIIETMISFFLAFESRKPQARELVTIAVMCALAVASRVVVPIPNFKPVIAIIMITGMAFGAQTGFMTGAISAFASNFFYSQGPWTPWQMMAYGMAGFLTGLLLHKRRRFCHPAILSIYGFVVSLLLVGPLLDCSTLFTTGSALSWRFAMAVFAAGLPHNFMQALACSVTLLLLSKPLLYKLDRLKKKYGMLDH